MRNARALALVLLGFVLLPACGSSGGADAVDSGPVVDGGSTVDALPGATTKRLVSSQFALNQGEEYYQCQRVTITDALHILKVTPVSPTGVHHEVFAIDESHTMP